MTTTECLSGQDERHQEGTGPYTPGNPITTSVHLEHEGPRTRMPNFKGYKASTRAAHALRSDQKTKNASWDAINRLAWISSKIPFRAKPDNSISPSHLADGPIFQNNLGHRLSTREIVVIILENESRKSQQIRI